MIEPSSATGLLLDFAQAGMISLPDYHLAKRMCHSSLEQRPDVQLAFALCVRQLRQGSVCLPIADAHLLKPIAENDDGSGNTKNAELVWPEPTVWLSRVQSSVLVGSDKPFKPFALSGGRLYLQRYFRQENKLRELLMARRGLPAASLPDSLSTGEDPQQDAAVVAAVTHLTSVITGGPGTGKTTTVRRVLQSLVNEKRISIALAAPTGKAARQLHESVTSDGDSRIAEATTFSGTLHRLLGSSPRQPDGAYSPDNPLPYDVIVVDETSMVSLEQMTVLLDSVGPQTRLILVGDPHQLRSVEAGAVLADLVASETLIDPAAVVKLVRNYRSDPAIGRLAGYIDSGDASGAARVIAEEQNIDWIDYSGERIDSLPTLRADVAKQLTEVTQAAEVGDARRALRALNSHRILCGHTLGPNGVEQWAKAARSIGAHTLAGYAAAPSYCGQPLLVTKNSERFNNGDVAVILRGPGGLIAAVDQGGAEPVLVSPSLLGATTDLHAMTVHKAQGAGFDAVSVVLPPPGSPLATRELLYTAVTRAKNSLRIYGSQEAFDEAIATPVRRASGLAEA